MKLTFTKNFQCCIIGFILFLCSPPLLNAQTITYSGTNVGIGSTSPGQVLDVQGTVRALGYENSLSLVATASPSAVSSITISSLSPGTRYALFYNLIQNTSNGYYALNFNGDTPSTGGTNYEWSDGAFLISTYASTYLNSTSYINLAPSTGHSVTTGSPIKGVIYFETWPGNNDNIIVNFSEGYYDYNGGNNTYAANVGSGQYTGSASLSSVTLTTSAGTMTGTAKLYILN